MTVSASSTAAEAGTPRQRGLGVGQAGPDEAQRDQVGDSGRRSPAAARGVARRSASCGSANVRTLATPVVERRPRARRTDTAAGAEGTTTVTGASGSSPCASATTSARASSAGRPKGVRTSRAMPRTVPTTSDTARGRGSGILARCVSGGSSSSSSPWWPATERLLGRRRDRVGDRQPGGVLHRAASGRRSGPDDLRPPPSRRPRGHRDGHGPPGRRRARRGCADEMRLLADTFAEVTAVLDEVDPSDPAAPNALGRAGHRRRGDRRRAGGGERLLARRVPHRPGRDQRGLGDHLVHAATTCHGDRPPADAAARPPW